ncbi:MAG: ATP-binding protein [Acidobacteriota bacterium]|nr:MAG: ATP-binding protein [Acidobacteriota bacterium]
MGEKREQITISSRIEAIDEAVTKAVTYAKGLGFSDDAIFGIDMAVREAVANAVKHGNGLDESKSVEITLADIVEGLEITVRDYGRGFNVEDVPDPTNPENLLKENGRGILFMQNFVTTVEWHNHPEGGMLVRMVKEL